ncbi:LapA family protein [Lentzea sp. NPDC042327]|uniref:LapA family protein n=1 Tax=Lentzea sp. NPDC042327 TaxID=3154801 RepID=UPI0033F63498
MATPSGETDPTLQPTPQPTSASTAPSAAPTTPITTPPATTPGDTTGTVAQKRKPRPTRISGTWVAVLVALVVLIFLLVFILQNGGNTTIYFLGGQSTLPLGVALLFAAIGGGLLVAVVGAARIMQLRRQAKRAQVVPSPRPGTSAPARRES